MKKKTAGCVILAAILATSITVAPALAQTEYLIVPGRSIGKLSLTMPVEEFRAKLGEPTGVDLLEQPSGFAMLYWWRNHGIGIATRPAQGNQVFLILLFLAAQDGAMKYRTIKNGLGLGSFRSLVIATYGKPAIDGEWLYFENGLVFGFLGGVNQANVVGVWRHIPRPTPPPKTSPQANAPSAGPTGI